MQSKLRNPTIFSKIGGKKGKRRGRKSQGRAHKTKKEDEEVQEERKAYESWDEEVKVWNLRLQSVIKANAGGQKENVVSEKSKSQPQLRSSVSKSTDENEGNSGGGEKKEKDNEKKEMKKLGIENSLAKKKIEEDNFAVTGAKPSHRSN